MATIQSATGPIDTADMGLTGAVGYRVTSVDYDGDGWADLFVRLGGAADDFSPAGKRTSFLMRNDKGHFTDVTIASGIRARRDGNAAKGHPGEVVAFGDVDNDGHVDVFVGVTTDPKDPETSELYLSNGDGTFRLGPASNPMRQTSVRGGYRICCCRHTARVACPRRWPP